METQGLLNKEVGTKDYETLKPEKVIIRSVNFQTETKDGKKMKSPLAVLKCKHPQKEEVISITKAKVEREGNLIVVGLWCQLDEDGLFQKSFAISKLLQFLNVKTLSELVNKEIETVRQSESSSFLCLKAY